MYIPMAFNCSKHIENLSNIRILKFVVCLSQFSVDFWFFSGTSKFSQFQGHQNRATWWPAFLYSVFLFDNHRIQAIKKPIEITNLSEDLWHSFCCLPHSLQVYMKFLFSRILMKLDTFRLRGDIHWFLNSDPKSSVLINTCEHINTHKCTLQLSMYDSAGHLQFNCKTSDSS